MAYALRKSTSNLLEFGYGVYKLGDYGITQGMFNKLQSQTQDTEVKYVHLRGGDTGESASADVFRLKHPANHNVSLEESVEILSSSRFNRFVRCETLMHNFDLARIQSHIYRPGDFLARHTDADSDNFLYTFIFMLQACDQGGEFVLEMGSEELTFPPEEGTLIVLDSRIPHEVMPIIEGNRRTLCAFLRKA